MPKKYHYQVAGRWPFPTDMLRRDESEALSDADHRVVVSLSGDHMPDYAPHLEAPINLIGPNRPNVERWNSFDWKVIEIDEYSGSTRRSIPVHPPVEEQQVTTVRDVKKLTPTWKACMPIIILALTHGTEEGQRLAKAELMDLANRIDQANRLDDLDIKPKEG
jgi:hypothetical protein